MLIGLVQILFVVFVLFLFGSLALYLLFLNYSWLQGAPYVGTKQEEVEKILKNLPIKKKQTFVDLGCGDGRVVRTAVKQYGVNGIGVDINPTLIAISRILSFTQGLRNITFRKENILITDISNADLIYIFLFPKLIEKLKESLLKKTKKSVIIVSHGFKIPFLSKYIIKTIPGSPFKTWVYQKN